MTKEEIIGNKEERLKRIGGSEFGTIMEVNPYSKRIDLVLEKAGIIANTFEGNAATRRGEFLEDEVIARFEDETNLKVTNEQEEFIKKATPYCLELRCHVDGITSDDAVFEAKTTDIKSKTWQNGIPEGYKAQLEFNCYLAKKKKAYIAVGICDGEEIVDFKWFPYEPSMTEEEILDYCFKFTEDVEYYKQFKPINNGKIIQSGLEDSLIEELNELNEKIAKIKAEAKPLEDKKKKIEEKLKNEIGQNLGIETELFRITMGNRITSPSQDYKFCRSGLKIEYKEV
ncbi:YqaJ viral recombinase family protein [Faecalibacillus faecis]|uniref:YqaJ viral recombinase family protein n=1 Tax=Faecalibacillus faecis TaxID=1982628 RepID=UPI0038678F58